MSAELIREVNEGLKNFNWDDYVLHSWGKEDILEVVQTGIYLGFDPLKVLWILAHKVDDWEATVRAATIAAVFGPGVYNEDKSLKHVEALDVHRVQWEAMLEACDIFCKATGILLALSPQIWTATRPIADELGSMSPLGEQGLESRLCLFGLNLILTDQTDRKNYYTALLNHNKLIPMYKDPLTKKIPMSDDEKLVVFNKYWNLSTKNNKLAYSIVNGNLVKKNLVVQGGSVIGGPAKPKTKAQLAAESKRKNNNNA